MLLARAAALLFLLVCAGASSAAQQTITFDPALAGIPNSFADTGFTFSVTSNQVSTGDQPYFQAWTPAQNGNGVKFASLTLATDTVTMRRTDNGNFVMVSLWVKNLTSNKTMTVTGRLGGSTVRTFTVAANASQVLNFTNATVDQVRIDCAVDDTWAYAGVFDNFIFDVPNGAPAVANLAGDTATFTQGGTAVKLDQGTAATVTDTDSADFNGGNLTASIITNKWSAQDQLAVGNLGTISVSGTNVLDGATTFGSITSNGLSGNNLVVTFNASATPARVQNLLRALTYGNSNTTNPDLGPRTVRVTVNDGDGAPPPNNDITVKVAPSALSGSIQTVSFNGLTLANAPASFVADGFRFTMSGGSSAYFQTSTSTPVPPGVVMSDNTITSPTMTIERTDSSDFNPNSIILGNLDDNTAFTIRTRNNGATVQTLTLAAGATQRVAFTNGAIDQITVQGQTSPSTAQMGIVDELVINVANAAPVIAGLAGESPLYTQGAGAVVLDSNGNATVTDSDSPDFNGGAVAASITGNKWNAQDLLQVGNVGTITVSGTTVSDGATAFGTITGNGQGGNDLIVSLNASATPARVQNLLRALQYNNSNTTNPDLASRSLRVTVSDGDGAPPLNSDLEVRLMPSALPAGVQTVVDFSTVSIPALTSTFDHQGYRFTLTGGTQRYFQTYSGGIPLAPAVRALDTTISNLTLTIRRVDSADFTLNSLIAGNFDDNTTLTLNARNNGGSVQTLTLAPRSTQRLVFTNPVVDEIVITGQTDPSAAAMAFVDEISIVPPPSPPDVNTSAGTASYVENAAATIIDPAATLTDPNNAWSSGTLKARVSANSQPTDRLSLGSASVTVNAPSVLVDGVTVGTISGGGTATGSADLTITLNASATNTSVQKLARAFRFDSTSDNPSTTTRTVTFEVSDGALSDTATRGVTVAAANDAPALTVAASMPVVEDVPSTLGSFAVADVDAGNGALKLTLSVPAGTLTATASAGITITGNGTATLSVAGTATALNTYLAGTNLGYLTAANANGTVTLTATLDDQGNTGGAAQSDTKSITLAIEARPDADIALTLSNAQPFVPGGTTTHYLVDLTNAGSDSLTSLPLDVTVSANLGNVVWSCAATAPASCPAASGSGVPDLVVNLPAGGALHFQIDADVAATPELSADIAASLTTPATLQDPTPNDHGANLSTTVGLFRNGFQNP